MSNLDKEIKATVALANDPDCGSETVGECFARHRLAAAQEAVKPWEEGEGK